MNKIKKLMFWLVGIYLLIGVLLYFFQERMLFLPETLPTDYVFKFDTPFEEVFLDVEDGARLHAIHFKNENPYGLILYFHGNAGSLKRWGTLVQPLVAKNYDVLVMDYRTYGKSDGNINENKLLADALKWYEYATKHYKESEITLYGRSLGTGFASYVASQNMPRQLILETPYSSISDVASIRFPIYPAKLLVRYEFEPILYLEETDIPISIFHGTDDTVVPYRYGEKLFNSLGTKTKRLITIPGGNHNNLSVYPDFQRGIDSILNIKKQ